MRYIFPWIHRNIDIIAGDNQAAIELAEYKIRFLLDEMRADTKAPKEYDFVTNLLNPNCDIIIQWEVKTCNKGKTITITKFL
jgi:hypothetical protein